MFWRKKQKYITLPDDLVNSSFAYVDKALPDLKPIKETGFLKNYFKQWFKTMKFLLTGK